MFLTENVFVFETFVKKLKWLIFTQHALVVFSLMYSIIKMKSECII